MKTNNMKRLIAVILLIVSMFSVMPVKTMAANSENGGQFELPLEGSTGFASSKINLRESIPGGKILRVLIPGTAFTILADGDSYLKVVLEDGVVGYAYKQYVMVNLPDIIPSIVYYNTNSTKSIYHSSEKDLPNVTGYQLYNVQAENQRFGEVQYVMPVLLSMAYKIQAAQTEALANGDSLKIYETFRPYETQMSVSTNLSVLMNSDAVVSSNINTYPWHKGWFIATSRSNHQHGMAMDCSLVKVGKTETRTCGSYEYKVVTECEEYAMPTQMHELSALAATFTTPVSSGSKTAWKSATLSKGMLESEGAQKLQKFCTNAGLSPLASEWWHFNDLDSDRTGLGEFYLLGGKPNADGSIPTVVNATSRIPG